MNAISPAIFNQILDLATVMPVQSPVNEASTQAKAASENGKQQPEAAGAPQTIQLPAFDAMAMPARAVHAHHHHALPKKASVQPRTSRSTSKSRNAAGAAGNNATHDTDLDAAADWLLTAMNSASSHLTTDLEDRYDPLERYQLYEHASTALDQSGMDEASKKRIRQELDARKAELKSTHGDAIAHGLEATRDMDAALTGMDRASKPRGMNAGSPEELRAFYGSKGGGREVSALRSRDMLAKMRETYGDDKVQEAMSDLRTKMLGRLSTRNPNNLLPRTGGAKLWLSLDDAAAFRSLQSNLAAAHDLRIELAGLGVQPRQTDAGMADKLMALPEAGKVRAGAMIEEMADFKTMRPIRRAKVYAAIRRTIANLPDSAWPEEGSARNDILGDLDNKSRAAFLEVPTQATREQRGEQNMRGALGKEEGRQQQAAGNPVRHSRG